MAVFAIKPLARVVFINLCLPLYRSLFPRRIVPVSTEANPIKMAISSYLVLISVFEGSNRKSSAASGAETLISFDP